MKLNVQKRLAGIILKCSPKRVKIDPERASDVKEAITKIDLKGLIKDKALSKSPIKSVSRVRARKNQKQKRSGRKKGYGSRKGKHNARLSTKSQWINKVRAQRELLARMKSNGLLSAETYRDLYNKSKGGFFRSKSHLKLYVEERNLFQEK